MERVAKIDEHQKKTARERVEPSPQRRPRPRRQPRFELEPAWQRLCDLATD
jgi:hypothetical protein